MPSCVVSVSPPVHNKGLEFSLFLPRLTLGGVVLARIKGEELPWGWSSTVVAPSLLLSVSLVRPRQTGKLSQCSQTTANGVPFSMRLLSLLLINFGRATYDCSYKSWWLSLASNKYLDINIHNKAAVIHWRTMTYAAATKRRSGAHLHIRSETWFEKLDVMLTLPCIFPLNKFCTWKYWPRLHLYISCHFIQPLDI